MAMMMAFNKLNNKKKMRFNFRVQSIFYYFIVVQV